MFRETGTVTCAVSKSALLPTYSVSHTSANEYVDYLIYDTVLISYMVRKITSYYNNTLSKVS